MRASLHDYRWLTAKSLKEALHLLSDQSARPMAGGTDLMVLFEAGKLPPGAYLNILDLPELHGIRVEKNQVLIGPLTTYTEIRSHPVIEKEFQMLVSAARVTGAVAIQNRGTIGGNIANASPAADSSPPLLAYDAHLEIQSGENLRTLPYADFHLGYKKTSLRPQELITKVILPRTTKGAQIYFRKVGTREAQAISKTCFAALARTQKKQINDVRIAFGSVAAIPLRCQKTERALLKKRLNKETIELALDTLASEISPLDDLRSTKEYRLKVSQNLLRDFLEGLR